jgi:hypothetical protein
MVRDDPACVGHAADQAVRRPTALEPPGLLSNQLQQEAVVEGVAGVGSPEPSRGELEQRFHLGPRAQAAGV